MIETLIWFDIVSNFVINQTGEKTIYIWRIGNEKIGLQLFLLMLLVSFIVNFTLSKTISKIF
jgi:hypothetical protein